jgi:hypothetical protein
MVIILKQTAIKANNWWSQNKNISKKNKQDVNSTSKKSNPVIMILRLKSIEISQFKKLPIKSQ